MRYRRPIISVLGHVDHGKTELLDSISYVDEKVPESGGITQQLKVTNLSDETLEKVDPDLYEKLNFPGFVWIDTPGHNAFSAARKKGGSFADIAVLVVDIKKGIQPQTVESINILKSNKTPFVVALNKVDKIKGWEKETKDFREKVRQYSYEIIGELYKYGIDAKMYSDIEDFEKSVSVVPISAKKIHQVDKLIKVVAGLTQKYLKENIKVSQSDNLEAVVLDTTNIKGFGKVASVLIYDGATEVGEEIYINKSGKNTTAKIKNILKHSSSGKSSFNKVSSASAAIFVQINLTNNNFEVGDLLTEEVENKDVQKINLETDKKGLVVCSDTDTSLSAVVNQLREDYKVSFYELGNVTKRNVMQASSMQRKEHKVVLGFNVGIEKEAEMLSREEDVEIITNDVIHKLIDKYNEYRTAIKGDKSREIEKIIYPSKIEVMNGFIFNRSNPAIVGVELKAGELHTGCEIIKDLNNLNNTIGKIQSIEVEGEKKDYINSGEASIEISNAEVGRDFNENQILFSKPPKKHILEAIKRDSMDDLSRQTLKIVKVLNQHYSNTVFDS